MRVQLPCIERISVLWLLRVFHRVIAPDKYAVVVPHYELDHVFGVLQSLLHLFLGDELRRALQRLALLALDLPRDFPDFILRLLLAPDEDVSVQRALVADDLSYKFPYVITVGESNLDVPVLEDLVRMKGEDICGRIL